MWTPETRAEHDRDDLRYPSDLSDAEWQILAPLLPPPGARCASSGGTAGIPDEARKYAHGDHF